jgi:hypothetical protein
MTTKEYDEKKKIIEEEKNEKLRDLDWEFVASQNKYKKGDIIEDNLGKGEIEKLTVGSSLSSRYPEAVYLVTILNKDGTPTKKKVSKRYIFKCNIKENKQ